MLPIPKETASPHPAPAGPSGGSEQKPVGTVFIGLAGPFETVVVKNYNPYDRETFKQVTADQALNLLRLKLT